MAVSAATVIAEAIDRHALAVEGMWSQAGAGPVVVNMDEVFEKYYADQMSSELVLEREPDAEAAIYTDL